MSKIYIDTSVLGGCFDIEFKTWSNKLIESFLIGKYSAVISDLTLRELENAPLQVRNIFKKIPEKYIIYIISNSESKKLRDEYIKEKIVTKKYLVDAEHIALATVNNIDVLVSWNFKHIVNYNKIRQYNAINYKIGYKVLEIRTPREVVDEE